MQDVQDLCATHAALAPKVLWQATSVRATHRGGQEAVADVRPAQVDTQHRHRDHQQRPQAGAQAELHRLRRVAQPDECQPFRPAAHAHCVCTRHPWQRRPACKRWTIRSRAVNRTWPSGESMRWAAAARLQEGMPCLLPGVEGLVGDGAADDGEECRPGDAEPLQQVGRRERSLRKGLIQGQGRSQYVTLRSVQSSCGKQPRVDSCSRRRHICTHSDQHRTQNDVRRLRHLFTPVRDCVIAGPYP